MLPVVPVSKCQFALAIAMIDGISFRMQFVQGSPCAIEKPRW
jgi:hypothetical protein